MCKGGSRTTETQQVTGQSQDASTWGHATSEADPYARNPAIEAMLETAYRARQGMNPTLQNSINEAVRAGQVTQPYLERAGSAIDRASGDVNLQPLEVDRYYNPFATSVYAGLNQNLGIKEAQLRSANAAAMGGIGGDRAAVSEALNFQQDQLARGQLGAQLYQQALQTAQQQQGARYGADVANRSNQYNAANAWLSQYGYGQSAAANAGRTLEDDQFNRWGRVADMAARLAPVIGMRQNTGTEAISHAAGTMYGRQTQSTQQDPVSQIAGLAMTGLGLAAGNPSMAMGGMSGMGGGSGMGGAQGYGGGLFGSWGGFGSGFGGGQSGYATPAGWGSGAAIYKRGGRINPWVARKAVGGPLTWDERSEPVRKAIRSGTFMPRYDEDRFADWPPSIPEGPANIRNFNDRASPHISAIDDGVYDPQGENSTDFRGSEAMRASNEGVIPLPASRPEDAGPSRMADDEMSSSNPYSITRSAPLTPRGITSGGEDIDIPREPVYAEYKRPGRNWSEFLLRAGLATLAARGDTDSGGVPRGSLSNIGKGALSALDQEGKDRAEARKEVELKNYGTSLLDSARLRRTQMQVTRQNAIDAAEERRLTREALGVRHKESLAERERHNRAAEESTRMRAEARAEQIRIGRPYSDDQITYKAQVRADNAVKAGTSAGFIRNKAQKDAEWQKVYDETREALMRSQADAISMIKTGKRPEVSAMPAPAAPSQTEAPPPEAMARLKQFLKPGEETRLNNGQVWTLDPNGEPKRVR